MSAEVVSAVAAVSLATHAETTGLAPEDQMHPIRLEYSDNVANLNVASLMLSAVLVSGTAAHEFVSTFGGVPRVWFKTDLPGFPMQAHYESEGDLYRLDIPSQRVSLYPTWKIFRECIHLRVEIWQPNVTRRTILRPENFGILVDKTNDLLHVLFKDMNNNSTSSLCVQSFCHVAAASLPNAEANVLRPVHIDEGTMGWLWQDKLYLYELNHDTRAWNFVQENTMTNAQLNRLPYVSFNGKAVVELKTFVSPWQHFMILLKKFGGIEMGIKQEVDVATVTEEFFHEHAGMYQMRFYTNDNRMILYVIDLHSFDVLKLVQNKDQDSDFSLGSNALSIHAIRSE